MMQAIEEEKEKEDNIISETVEEENDSKENMPKEVTSSEEMPTEEAVVLPEFPDEEKKKLDGSVNVVLSRNGVKTFFIGPDYKNIQIAKEELEKMKNARVELFRLLKEVKTVENKNAVKERIAEMSDIINSSETHIYKQENKFSLFGWFYEIILDKK